MKQWSYIRKFMGWRMVILTFIMVIHKKLHCTFWIHCGDVYIGVLRWCLALTMLYKRPLNIKSSAFAVYISWFLNSCPAPKWELMMFNWSSLFALFNSVNEGKFGNEWKHVCTPIFCWQKSSLICIFPTFFFSYLLTWL